MAKDPAVLWYWNDWQGGTATLSRHLKGCYVDLLHAQFNTGRLSLAQIKMVLGSDFGQAWPILLEKFKRDENGKFYNQRAEQEKIKRQKYTESRKKNLKKPHMELHMGAHMENENENVFNTNTSNNSGAEKNLKPSKPDPVSPNMKWKKQFVETETQIENAIKSFRNNKLKGTKDNVLHLLGVYTDEIEAKTERKNSFREYASHFISWANMHGTKHELKSKSMVGL